MQFKISLKRLWVVVCVAGIAFSLAMTFFLTLASLGYGFFAGPASSTGDQASRDTRPGLPIRLKIPEINIDAAIEDAGLTPQGTMGVPAGPANAAWFDLGPRPGENGSAVIAGHEGWKNGIPAVFDNLFQLKKGDKVYIEDAKGTSSTFVVREVRTYDQNGDASAVFGSGDGKAHLNLITCEGIWNAAQKSYSDRLVVFTDME